MATAIAPRKQSQRRLGLTRERMRYGHLLVTLPQQHEGKVNAEPTSLPAQSKLPRIYTDDNLDAPPEGSSDEQSPPATDSDDEFAVHERPRKKVRLSVGSQDDAVGDRMPASVAVQVVPSGTSSTARRASCQPFDKVSQKKSTQGSTNGSDDGNGDLERMRALAKRSEKRRRSYGYTNIHAAAPAEKTRRPPRHRDVAPREGKKPTKGYGRKDLRQSASAGISPGKRRSIGPKFHLPLQPSSSQSKSRENSPSTFKMPRKLSEDALAAEEATSPIAFHRPSRTSVRLDGDAADVPDPSLSQLSQTSLVDFDDTLSGSPLTSPSDSPEKPEFDNPREVTFFIPTKACPMCNAPVDKIFMEEHLPGIRPSVKQQTLFCRTHRLRDARAIWTKMAYPKDLGWTDFDARLQRHHPDIEAILSGRRTSFYRDIFAKHIASGQNRTLRQRLAREPDVEGLSSGYYGSKGTKLIIQNILAAFSPTLRRLAATDKLIADGGVSAYVQAVLAPEMAVSLVREDMNVDGDRAREILRESEVIGNLINEEEDEIVLGDDEG